MAKVFYTERDIEDIVKAGKTSLVYDDNTVLTELAYEKAKSLGVKLLQPHDNPPSAPIRPYVNQPIHAAIPAMRLSAGGEKLALIRAKVKLAVKEQFGYQVDDAVLDRIIERVAAQLGLL